MRPPVSAFSASSISSTCLPRCWMLLRSAGVTALSTAQATSSARGLAVMVLPYKPRL
jgi:hypothetical protein